MRALDAAPAGLTTIRAWDLAATKQTGIRDPDWTVGTLLGRSQDGSYVILDMVRFRGGPEEVEAAILPRPVVTVGGFLFPCRKTQAKLEKRKYSTSRGGSPGTGFIRRQRRETKRRGRCLLRRK